MVIKRLFLLAMLYSSVLFAFGLLLSYFIRWWPFELLLSGTPHVLAVLSATLLMSVLFADRVLQRQQLHLVYVTAIVGYGLGLASLIFSLSIQPPVKAAITGRPTVVFATQNTLYKNTDHQRIAAYIKEQSIDIIALQEVEPQELEAIRLAAGYEHSYTFAGERAFFGTTGLVSQLPILSATGDSLGVGYSYVRAVIEATPGKEVAFYSIHIMPPFSPAKYHIGNQQLMRLQEILSVEKLPAVVGGDFNTTIFSPYLRDFTKRMQQNFKPVTVNRWPQCSWYAPKDFVCLRIDHIYISSTAQLNRTWVAPYLGSDHRMVVAEFSF